MEKGDIEKRIRLCFRQNYFQDPSLFTDIAIEAIKVCKVTAKGYWDHRSLWEIKIDQRAGVIAADYELWIKQELYQLKTKYQEN